MMRPAQLIRWDTTSTSTATHFVINGAGTRCSAKMEARLTLLVLAITRTNGFLHSVSARTPKLLKAIAEPTASLTELSTIQAVREYINLYVLICCSGAGMRNPGFTRQSNS